MKQAVRTFAAALLAAVLAARGAGPEAFDERSIAPVTGVEGQRSVPEALDAAMGALAAEFPPSDLALWTLHRDGMVSTRAVRQLAAAPDSPETLELLLNRGRLDDALRVLRTIVDSRPAQLESALALVGRSSYRFRQNQPRGYATTLRGIVAAARRRLPALPREEAARIARELALLENGLTGGGSAGWQQQLARLIAEYPDTEMARLVQVDEMTAGRVSEAQLEQLAEFARTHPRSTVGAKALYNLGFQLANNVAMSGLEPRGADPAPRFLRVVAIANQLQDGLFPPCEWVRQAPSLVTGFFAAAPVYGDGSIDRMLDAASAFAKAHFIRPDGQPDPDAVEYLITKKMADLFDRKGEPIVGVERVLMSLERGAAGHDAAKFMRASFYVSARQSRPPEERAGLTRKAIETLDLAPSGKRRSLRAQVARRTGVAAVCRRRPRRGARQLPELPVVLSGQPLGVGCGAAGRSVRHRPRRLGCRRRRLSARDGDLREQSGRVAVGAGTWRARLRSARQHGRGAARAPAGIGRLGARRCTGLHAARQPARGRWRAGHRAIGGHA